MEWRELYQEMILEHSRSPRHFTVMADADRQAEGFNPICGDRYVIYLKMDGDVIQDVSFQGSGCAISKASVSMMTACLKGKTKAEAETLFDGFHKLITGKSNGSAGREQLGKLMVFQGVSEFPMRVKCANLGWHTLRAALKGNSGKISTE